MALYSVLSENYEVSIYGSMAGVVRSVDGNGLVLADDTDDDARAATATEIAKALRKDGVVRLYEPGQADWKYRVEKQIKQ